MALPTLPLGYCTNVHPGRTVAEVLAGLDRYTLPVWGRVGRPVAAGLWLAKPVVDELFAAPDGLSRFRDELAARDLPCYTLNAFPYGDFHAARVKEQVYRPDWSTPERSAYTSRCAAVLTVLLPDGVEGSISTLPLGFKGFDHPGDFLDGCARRLLATAVMLDRRRWETGRVIRLAVEPEPFCLLETTAETVSFFERLWQLARHNEAAVREHIGVCYDVCHQAVEFEDAADVVRRLDRAGVRINKVQVSCAIQLDRPGENPGGVAALRRYIEPRYLHQTFARRPNGEVVERLDLSEEVLADPLMLAADTWRVHFHVPVDADRLGPLGTTRPAVAEALAAVAALPYAPHVEVETYTWEVLPGAGPGDLVGGLARELEATHRLVAAGGRP
ncbi:MAG: metabolite traffic protein EboE [Gemmataceae bacterium]|nr:metabolite traffic protein EboE [Gemmataceae bacterium]